MDKGQTIEEKVLAEMPAFLAATVQRDDALRFAALGLLEKARSRAEDISADPPADSAAAALAALPVIHLTIRALLAARGLRSFSVRASLFLLRVLYPSDLPEETIAKLSRVQTLTLKGGDALAAARSFTDLAEKLLSKSA